MNAAGRQVGTEQPQSRISFSLSILLTSRALIEEISRLIVAQKKIEKFSNGGKTTLRR